MSIWALSSLLQFASLFGVGNENNYRVWRYGLGFLGTFSAFVIFILLQIAYQDAFTFSEDSSNTQADQITAASFMSEMQTDIMKLIVYGSWTAVIMTYNYRDWKRAQLELNPPSLSRPDDGWWIF